MTFNNVALSNLHVNSAAMLNQHTRSFFLFCRPPHGGAAAAPAGGTHLQGVYG